MNVATLLRRYCWTIGYLLVAGLHAAAPTWDNLRLPPNPSERDIVKYLGTLRNILNPEPGGMRYGSERRKPPALEKADVQRAQNAFAELPPDATSVVLRECVRAERDWTNQFEIPFNAPDGSPILGGYGDARVTVRSPFTRVALQHVIRSPDMPAAQRQRVFEHLGDFPELMQGLAWRSWIKELDSYITPALIRRVDRTTGWRQSSASWINALRRLDTKRGWDALALIIIEAKMDVRLEAYSRTP